MMDKITFLDKEDSVIKPIPDIHKIVADDMNSIKRVINQNVDQIEENLEDIGVALAKLSLIEKSKILFDLKENSIQQGSFTTDSLDFDNLTYFRFNNVDLFNRNLLNYFELLLDSKDDLFLRIKNNDSDDLSFFKINGAVFNEDDTTTITLSKYKTLSLGQLDINGQYEFEIALERSPDFTDTQLDRLKDSVYEAIVQSISVSPTTFEKGLATNLVYTWNVNRRDDTLNVCTVDNIDKLAEATGINRTYNVNNQVATKQVFLSTNVTRNDIDGGSFTTNTSATSTAIIPQYYGLVANGDEAPLTYALLNPDPNTNIKKWLSAVSAKSVVLGTDLPTPSNQHFFFLSTNANAVILDVNGFNVTPAFTKTTVTMKLADGTDQSITQYKTTLTLNSTGTFTIN